MPCLAFDFWLRQHIDKWNAKQIKNELKSFVKGHLRSSLISARELCVGVTDLAYICITALH